MNQHEAIIDYMRQFGSITPMDAFNDLGITKLSTRIGELVQRGHAIGKRWEQAENRFGKVTHFRRYWLEE